MNMAALDVVGFGIAVVALALLVLLVMVHFDLGPVSGLSRRRHWLLAGALGSGIFAFAFKILLIVVIANTAHFSHAKAQVLAQQSAKQGPSEPRPERYRWQSMSSVQVSSGESGGYVWEALPRQLLANDNPVITARVALGERLFFDKRLSRDGTLACSSCHNVRSGAGADGRPTALGINNQRGTRNTPTVWNAAFQARLFWDGRAASLEEQARGPLLNPKEMGMPSLEAVVQRVAAEPGYRVPFARAFPDGGVIDIEQITTAIATYERTLITPDTPYDRFVHGELDALTPEQLRGMALFESVGCISCHSGPNFSGASRFNGAFPLRIFPAISTPYETRFHLTEDSGAADAGSGRGVWRIPSLRNVALTAPYFHNGSVSELEEAVRIMTSVQLGHTGPLLVWSDRDKRLRAVTGRALSEAQIKELTAFLHALSSDEILTRLAQSEVQKKRVVRYAAN